MTLGNALRRVLLSSLPGAAITSIKIEGVQHEFQDIARVKEDVTDIVLNVKRLRLRSYSDHPVTMRLDVTGEREVTAADIVAPSTVEIVNKELHIATLDSPDAHLDMDLVVDGQRLCAGGVQREPAHWGHPSGCDLYPGAKSQLRR
jgi:DNA-directed RNA polymerase subunit alpha